MIQNHDRFISDITLDELVRKKKEPNPKTRMRIAIGLGIVVIAIVILVNYYLDQTQISGQRFGDQLAQIQLDLKNETQNLDSHLTQYKAGQISKEQMLNITDIHLIAMQNILPRYDQLKAPELFAPSLELFKIIYRNPD